MTVKTTHKSNIMMVTVDGVEAHVSSLVVARADGTLDGIKITLIGGRNTHDDLMVVENMCATFGDWRVIITNRDEFGRFYSVMIKASDLG